MAHAQPDVLISDFRAVPEYPHDFAANTDALLGSFVNSCRLDELGDGA